MDIHNIKAIFIERLKSIFSLSSIWSRVKIAVRLPYAKTYIALAFFMILVFIVITFPYDMLLRNRLALLEKTVLKTIHVNEISAGLFNTIYLGNLYAILRTGGEISIRSTEIDISLLRIIFSNDIKATLQMTGFRYITETSQFSFNGNGNINLDYTSFSDPPRGGNISLIIDNAVLKLSDMKLDSLGGLPLSLPRMNINSMKLEAEISDKKIMIRNLRLFGKDLNGTVTGSISLGKNFLNSRMDIKIMLNPDSEALADYREFLSQFINDRNQIVIPLKGPLLNPRLETGQPPDSGSPPGSDHPMDQIVPVP